MTTIKVITPADRALELQAKISKMKHHVRGNTPDTINLPLYENDQLFISDDVILVACHYNQNKGVYNVILSMSDRGVVTTGRSITKYSYGKRIHEYTSLVYHAETGSFISSPEKLAFNEVTFNKYNKISSQCNYANAAYLERLIDIGIHDLVHNPHIQGPMTIHLNTQESTTIHQQTGIINYAWNTAFNTLEPISPRTFLNGQATILGIGTDDRTGILINVHPDRRQWLLDKLVAIMKSDDYLVNRFSETGFQILPNLGG